MSVRLRPFDPNDMNAILHLSLLAWEPVFVAWERILGPDLYPLAIYPDWHQGQQEAVETAIRDAQRTTWIAETDGKVVGFVAYELNTETKVGEVSMLAVHPEHQNQGVGTMLNLLALEKLKENGMRLAVVGTGGDEGHAPARRAYEKVGYTGLPQVRYYKAL